MKKAFILYLTAAMAMPLSTGAAQVGEALENFNAWPVLTNIYAGGTGELIGRSPEAPTGTGFSWGGWSPSTVNNGAINVNSSNTPAGPKFTLVCRPLTIVPGSYVYTIFDPAGGTNGDSIANLSAVTVVTQETTETPRTNEIRLLLRDGAGSWWLSTSAGKITVITDATPGGNSYPIAVATQSWEKLTGAAPANMNAMDQDLGVGAGPGALVAEAGTPDFSAVTGGGIYIEASVSGSGAMRLASISWKGDPISAVPDWRSF